MLCSTKLWAQSKRRANLHVNNTHQCISTPFSTYTHAEGPLLRGFGCIEAYEDTVWTFWSVHYKRGSTTLTARQRPIANTHIHTHTQCTHAVQYFVPCCPHYRWQVFHEVNVKLHIVWHRDWKWNGCQRGELQHVGINQATLIFGMYQTSFVLRPLPTQEKRLVHTNCDTVYFNIR